MQQTKYTPIPSELSQDEQHLFMMQTYENIPEWVKTMFKKRKGTSHLTKDRAMDAPWIQLHGNDRHWLMIDFDNNDEWDWKKLPLSPNVVSYNTDTGNHQALFKLKDPVHCHREAKKNAPYKFLRGLEKTIDVMYGGDTGFSRNISKNLFHPKWDTIWIHNREYTLSELQEHLVTNSDIRVGKRKKTPLCGKEGRNTAVFDEVRYKCYREVTKYKELDDVTFNDWHRMVLAWCRRANNFEGKAPMEDHRVVSTAKSIAEFCWYRYTPSKPKKKPMSPDKIKAAQSKAAKMTTAKKVGKNEAAVKEAIRQLKADGKKPTKAAVARLAGLGREAVSRSYSHLFD